MLLKVYLSIILVDIALCGISPPSKSRLPTTTLEDLKTFHNQDSRKYLRDSNGKIGAFSVTNLGDQFANAVQRFQTNGPDCFSTAAGLSQKLMSDGSTRRTFATEDQIYLDCIKKDAVIISKTFSIIEDLVSRLIDHVSGFQGLYILDGEDHLFLDSPHKDHLHVYSKAANKTTRDYLVPYHIDNGLFLIITPFSNPSLEMKLSDGVKVNSADLGPDGVIVVMGRGLTEWLLPKAQDHFYAVPHAVPSLLYSHFQHRTVFSRMKVVPYGSISAQTSSGLQFQQLFLNQQGSTQDLCLGSVPETHAHTYLNQFLQISAQECDSNSAYCWMTCLPLDDCRVENSECINDNNEPCFDDSMDPSCAWHCKQTTTTSPTTDAQTTTTSTTTDTPEPFCTGATDMLMEGFRTTRKVANSANFCIILFSKKWTLSSRWKFAVGSIGVFFLGFIIEGNLALRRKLFENIKLRGRWQKVVRLAITGVMYFVNLTLAYLAMLVAMTYSVELFLCVIMGLTVGHLVFNSKMPVGENIDPCCASEVPGKLPKQHNEHESHAKTVMCKAK